LKSLQKDANKIRFNAATSLRSSALNVADSFPFVISCLVGKKYLIDLLFALLSFERSVGGIGKLSILSDGTLTPEDVDFFSSWHSNCNVFLNIDELCEYYNYNPSSILLDFLDSGYFGAAKFFLLNAVQSRANCLLLDSDMVFFQNPLAKTSQLRHCILRETCASLEDDLESFDPAVIEYGEEKGTYVSKRVNVGLVYVPKSTFDFMNWSQHIPQRSIEKPHIFTEQSAVAAGLESVGYSLLSKSQYVVSSQGAVFPDPKSGYSPFSDIKEPYEGLVCRHFITPVRHLMWLKAFPILRDRLLSGF
jgi:hypothetical protein